MCDEHSTYTLWLPDKGKIGVDPCIANLVDALNRSSIPTVASCCGHGHRPGNIALADGRELLIAANYEQAREVDAAFPVTAYGEASVHGTEDKL